MSTFLEKLKNEPTIFCYSRVWRYAGHRRPFVILTVILSALNQLVALLEPVVIAYLINTVQSQGVTDVNIKWLILVASSLLGITVLRWILHFPARIFERHNAFIVSKNYMLYLTKNILDLELKWHNDRESGDTIDKVNNATTSLRTFTAQNFRILRVVIGFTGSCIAIAFFNPYIALGTFICTGLIFYMLYSFDKKLIPQYKQLNIYKNRISASVFDVLSNVTTVVILGIKKLVNKDIEKRIDKPYRLYLKNINLMEVKWATGSISFEIVFTIGLIFFFFTLLVSDEVIAVGSIAAIILYLQRLGDTFFAFGGLYEDIIITKTDILNAEKIEADFTSKKASRKVIDFQKNIALKNITFSYDDPEIPQLRDISLSIDKGEKIALVGESGSGKTTLLKLIHGLYQNSSGTILADGKKVGVKLDRLNLETMLVPQEPELFSATVKENITLGTSITKQKLDHILEMSRFADVVENLPRGLDSNINEKGVNLSGGQKQRLALARALVFSEGKSVILLDESTSSVDPKNERQIYHNIFSVHQDKTIIASIHKFNLLDMFDRIIVFDHGRVVGDGTLKELLASNKEFQAMKKSFEKSF